LSLFGLYSMELKNFKIIFMRSNKFRNIPFSKMKCKMWNNCENTWKCGIIVVFVCYFIHMVLYAVSYIWYCMLFHYEVELIEESDVREEVEEWLNRRELI